MAKSIPKKDYTGGADPRSPIELLPIGVIHSPHRERFGTPHQAVVPADPAHRGQEVSEVELFRDRVPAEALRDLDGFERLWIIALLHLNRGFNPLVSPPRDRNNRRGLLATRAPHRPNPVGLSAARILGVEGHRIRLERVDLLEGTPVLDIKPYVPYADAFPGAAAGWLDDLPDPRGD